jgi:hypothetical protein
MSASATVLHRHFEHVISTYHPFADYLGFSEIEDGFVLGYDGGNGPKYLVLDCEFNIISDETVGTARLMTFGGILLDAVVSLLND